MIWLSLVERYASVAVILGKTIICVIHSGNLTVSILDLQINLHFSRVCVVSNPVESYVTHLRWST